MGAKPNPKALKVERRKAIRFRLDAPAILEWIESSGEKREDIVQIHDVSILGAFVICKAALRAGTTASIQVHLPPLERNSSQLLRFVGSGKITRVSGSGKNRGLALSVRFVIEETALESYVRQVADAAIQPKKTSQARRLLL